MLIILFFPKFYNYKNFTVKKVAKNESNDTSTELANKCNTKTRPGKPYHIEYRVRVQRGPTSFSHYLR